MKRDKLLGIEIIALSLVLAAVGWLILPDTLIIQIGVNGQASNTLPKLPALLIPLALSCVFSGLYMGNATGRRSRDLLVAVAGIGMSIVMIVVNLAMQP